MLSSTSRTLTRIFCHLLFLLGSVLFLAPNWAVGNFPWNVSPFVVMTIGGWCLGNAVFAWLSTRIWDWKLIYPSLIYLWLFGLLKLPSCSRSATKSAWDRSWHWSYMVTIGVNVLAAAERIRRCAAASPGHRGGWQADLRAICGV